MEDDLLNIALMMAQELQEFADAAREAGNPLLSVEALIDDFNKEHQKQQPWQETLANDANEDIPHFLRKQAD